MVTESTATLIGFFAFNHKEDLSAGLEAFEDSGSLADLGNAYIACCGTFSGRIVVESSLIGVAVRCFDDDCLGPGVGGRKIPTGFASPDMADMLSAS